MDDKDGGTAVSVMNDQQCGRANEWFEEKKGEGKVVNKSE